VGSGPSPTPVKFSSHCCFYKLSHCWLLGGALHSCLLWLACLFTVHVGSGPSPPLLWSFLPPPLLQAFPLLVAGQVLPLLPSLIGLFIYSSMGDCPSPTLQCQATPPSLLCVFFVVVYYSVSLFSLGGGQSVHGAMLIWPRIVCGSIVCLLAHLVVCVFLSGLGTGIWWCKSPPGFSV
jgi:hypothetical protein